MADFNKDTFYILDSYGLIFRCYFAFINKPLTNSQGQNVSALFGFFRNLHYILHHYEPDRIACAMDSKSKTFRHEKFEYYKATRNKTPDDLHAQIPMIEKVLKALGIPVLQCEGYEADDVIATTSRICEENKKTCRILSGDKDLMQLVTENTQILKPDAGGTWKVTGIDGVVAEWGVQPVQLLDLLSLYGDTADNIPGVRGIGIKTAAKLLNEYQNLDGIYSHIDEIKGSVQQKLKDGHQSAMDSKWLVQLCSEVPCPEIFNAINSPALKLNYAAAAELLFSMGVPAVAKSYADLALKNSQEVHFPGTESFGSASEIKKTDTPAVSLASNSLNNIGLHNDMQKSNLLANLLFEDAPVDVVKNKGNYSAILKIEELSSLIDKILSQAQDNISTVSFDCETDSLDTMNGNIVGFSLCYTEGTAYYVPFDKGDLFSFGDFIQKEDAFNQLARLFFNPKIRVVMHNAKFDWKMLLTNGLKNPQKNQDMVDIRPDCLIFDTMIAAWLLSPDRTGKSAYGLEYLGENVLGLKGIEFDEIVAKGQTFMDVPLEQAVSYAAEDADFTFRLWKNLDAKLSKANLKRLFEEIEMPLLKILSSMEIQGIHLDGKILDEYNLELSEKIKLAESNIYREADMEFNIASPKQLQTVLFEKLSLPTGKKTKTGYSTDTTVLEELAYLNPVPKMILEYREMAKLQSTYVETLPKLCDKNGRVHTDFIQTGTATGRLSCREPNLQNIPVRSDAGRRIRSAFTAPLGKILISADYSQIELVVLSHLSGDENMCKAFSSGIDVHKATASLIYGVDMENVSSEMRRTAKTINFGVIYGMSAFRLAKDLGISRAQASEFIKNYNETYSGIDSFMKETVLKAEKNGYVETIFGRRRHILNINSRNKVEKMAAERIAINTPVQGSAADIVKKAMLDVDEALRFENNGARLLLQVHDELIVECPDDKAIVEKTIGIIKEKMENAVKLNVPLKVSIESGKNWGLFH